MPASIRPNREHQLFEVAILRLDSPLFHQVVGGESGVSRTRRYCWSFDVDPNIRPAPRTRCYHVQYRLPGLVPSRFHSSMTTRYLNDLDTIGSEMEGGPGRPCLCLRQFVPYGPWESVSSELGKSRGEDSPQPRNRLADRAFLATARQCGIMTWVEWGIRWSSDR